MPIGSGKPKVGDEAPAFDVVSSEGNRLRLEDYNDAKSGCDLYATVKGAAAFEKETFTAVTEARSRAARTFRLCQGEQRRRATVQRP